MIQEKDDKHGHVWNDKKKRRPLILNSRKIIFQMYWHFTVIFGTFCCVISNVGHQLQFTS